MKRGEFLFIYGSVLLFYDVIGVFIMFFFLLLMPVQHFGATLCGLNSAIEINKINILTNHTSMESLFIQLSSLLQSSVSHDLQKSF